MNEFLTETFLPIWNSGGTLMYPLAALAFLIYFSGVELIVYLNSQTGKKISSESLAQYIESPESAKPDVRRMIEYAQDDSESSADVANRFSEIRSEQLGRVDRRRLMLSVFVSAAPLTGLLGTVMGMLDTFKGLAMSSGGQTVNLVADGISQALITTQLGLIIAIPGYLMLSSIEKRRGKLDTVITSLESLMMQSFQSKKNLEEVEVQYEEKALV
ncbi:MAG: MotA/TolQ/ExbB proton channel family protein [Verrucomicrobiota bacterium]